MGKLAEEKVFRDPITGYVRIDDEVIWNCVNAREFQRLRRIRQLGSTTVAYHAGEHSRFSHSLGVYQIVRRMCNEVNDIANKLTEHEKLVVQLAGLLHDIGHAPFSHSFEKIMKTNHEDYTVQIISSDSEIYNVLYQEDPNLPKEVASVITGKHRNKILCQMISSQLDCDRMDYLLRDSYFTGVSYGNFDIERILRTLRVFDDKLVVKASGSQAVEDYIMARYYMYWQIYYHPVSRSFDVLLNQTFQRLKDLYQQDPSIVEKLPMYKDLLKGERMTNQQHFLLDDACCYYSFQLMCQLEDPILADLARRLLNRDLFKYDHASKKKEYYQLAKEKGFNTDYYISTDELSQKFYKPYSHSSKNNIWILAENNQIVELSDYSHIVKALCSYKEDEDVKVFFPKEILKND